MTPEELDRSLQVLASQLEAITATVAAARNHLGALMLSERKPTLNDPKMQPEPVKLYNGMEIE